MRLQMIGCLARPMLNSLAVAKQKLFSPKYLLYTNTGISACLSAGGDVLQQWYQANTKQKPMVWDQTRTKQLASTGLLIGPFIHYWYIFLDHWLPGRTFSVLCKKVILDQVICSPVYICIFIFSLCYMEDKTWHQVRSDLVNKGSVLFLVEWVVWLPAQFFNFFFLPTKYRVLYDSIISMAVDCFSSYVWYEMDREESADACTESCGSDSV